MTPFDAPLESESSAASPPSWDAERQETYSQSSSTAKAADSVWAKPAVTAAELKTFQKGGSVHTLQEAAALKSQIRHVGQPAEDALLAAAKNNRVLAFGDVHGAFGPHVAFLTSEMSKLKSNGVTNLALEIPKNLQYWLDSWSASDQDFIRHQFKDATSFVDLITAAKKAGIKVVAVDSYGNDHPESDPSRDVEMSKNIANVLKDPHSKVVFFVGAGHLVKGNRPDTGAPSTAQLLRDHNFSVSTFYPQDPGASASLMPIARDLRVPLNVATDKVEKVQKSAAEGVNRYGAWDNVTFYPTGYGMEKAQAELQRFGQDPLPVLEDAVHKNQVILMGEMNSHDLDHPTSVHRQYIASIIPSMKKAGLTDLALDIPESDQSALDKFRKTGSTTGLPYPYQNEDFRQVLNAARLAGIKLHAVGEPTANLRVIDYLNHLTDRVAALAKSDPKSKIMLWCPEAAVGNYKDMSLKKNLSGRGIATQDFASISEDFFNPDLGRVTGTLSAPKTFKPAQTTYLKELKNTQDTQVELFDNVIIYPNQLPPKK